MKSLKVLKKLCPNIDPSLNKNRCRVYRGSQDGDGDRYPFDFQICTGENGWYQYDTDQDAPYFGVWYSNILLATFSFAEGDLCLSVAPDEDAHKAELAEMAEFYGEPPPAFVVTDDDGQITQVYDENARPNLD